MSPDFCSVGPAPVKILVIPGRSLPPTARKSLNPQKRNNGPRGVGAAKSGRGESTTAAGVGGCVGGGSWRLHRRRESGAALA
jgi:hypothetical protein